MCASMRYLMITMPNKHDLSFILHYCSGNMSRGILRGRIHGPIMERRLQIEVHGLLRAATIHTEADLYHRWVVRVSLSLNGKPRCGPKRDIAEINPIFALSDRRAAKLDRENRLFVFVSLGELFARPTLRD